MSASSRIVTLETIVRESHAESGSVVRQLTSAPAIHANIYMDASYADASSRYIMYLKSQHSYGNVEVWRADLQRNRLERVCEDVFRWEGICASPDQQYFYCARRIEPKLLTIIRTQIDTLDQRTFVFDCGERFIGCLASATPDHRYLIMAARLGPHRHGILRFDLEKERWECIHEGGDELLNANAIVDPGEGRYLLVQNNRGAQTDEDGWCLRSTGPDGATLYLIDLTNGARIDLPVGMPYTGRCGGHSSWAGKTGAILTNLGWGTVELTQARGSIAVVRPGDKEARLIGQGLCAVHVNASRNGRFFVTDQIIRAPKDAQILVGSVKTGRYRVLCDHGSSFSAPQYTHPHPWLTPDCKWAVFNSDRYGAPHVFTASIPQGLLEELETT